MFGAPSTPLRKPEPPPTAPSQATPSVIMSGQRAFASAREANRRPSLSLVGASTGSGGMMQRTGTTRRRTLLGGS